MKLKIPFQFLLFLVIVFVFSTHTASVSASILAEDFDPTQNYSVHTMPVLSSEPQVSIHLESKNTSQETTHQNGRFSTVGNSADHPSFVKKFVDFTGELVTTFQRKLGFVDRVVRSATQTISEVAKTNAFQWTFYIGVFSVVSVSSIVVFSNPFALRSIKESLKASTDLEIRLVGVVSAILISGGVGVGWLSTYNQQITFFESYTGWKLNPIGQDLLFVGGFLGVSFLFLEGSSILFGAKSVVTAIAAFLPNWKKVVTYVAKETKTAFSETDKECDDRIDKCSSLFDKTVILLFNYLPGTMPDLGIDDAIINFKNNLFKPPSTQKAK